MHINADDFGLTPAINEAVMDLHAKRIIDSASVMVPGLAFLEAVKSHVPIGAHLTLSSGAFKLKRTARSGLIPETWREFKAKDAQEEIDAQLDRLKPYRLVHVDSHVWCIPGYDDTHYNILDNIYTNRRLPSFVYYSRGTVPQSVGKYIWAAPKTPGETPVDKILYRVKNFKDRLWFPVHVSTDKNDPRRYNEYRALLDRRKELEDARGLSR